jgi:hypothetical protein
VYARRGTLAPARGLREIDLRGAGESTWVVGAGPELGSWDPARGVPLGASVALPAGTVAEFKLVQRRKDGSVEWERGGNRYLFVREGRGPVVLQLEWRS